LIRSDNGASAVEYGLLLIGIAVAMLVSVSTLGATLTREFQRIDQQSVITPWSTNVPPVPSSTPASSPYAAPESTCSASPSSTENTPVATPQADCPE
jgi:Flp pilus assembly pilin Flp